jgi:hypothetical protein
MLLSSSHMFVLMHSWNVTWIVGIFLPQLNMSWINNQHVTLHAYAKLKAYQISSAYVPSMLYLFVLSDV